MVPKGLCAARITIICSFRIKSVNKQNDHLSVSKRSSCRLSDMAQHHTMGGEEEVGVGYCCGCPRSVKNDVDFCSSVLAVRRPPFTRNQLVEYNT